MKTDPSCEDGSLLTRVTATFGSPTHNFTGVMGTFTAMTAFITGMNRFITGPVRFMTGLMGLALTKDAHCASVSEPAMRSDTDQPCETPFISSRAAAIT